MITMLLHASRLAHSHDTPPAAYAVAALVAVALFLASKVRR